jgi:hypothetical protein
MKNAITGVLLGVLAAGSAAGAARDVSLTLTPTVGGYTFGPKERLVTKPAYGGKLGLSFLNDDGSDGISLEGTFNYVPTSSKADGRAVDAYLLRAEALYPVARYGDFSPFVAAGGGGIAFAGPGKTDGKSPFLDYGGGARYYLAEDIAIRADVRHMIIFDDRVGDRSNFEYTAGLNFFFGGDRKRVQTASRSTEPQAVSPPAVTPAPAPAIVSAQKPAASAQQEQPLPAPAEQPAPSPAPAEPSNVPPPQPAPVAAPVAAAAAAALERTVISSVRIEEDGIRITFTEPVGSFETFALSAPSRLVIDIPGATNGTEMKRLQVNRFGVTAVRIGTYPDKSRIVLDSTRKTFPEYGIGRDPRSLKILFLK